MKTRIINEESLVAKEELPKIFVKETSIASLILNLPLRYLLAIKIPQPRQPKVLIKPMKLRLCVVELWLTQNKQLSKILLRTFSLF